MARVVRFFPLLALGCAAAPPRPTADQLAFQNMEIGALVTYNMATAAETQGCPYNAPPPAAAVFNDRLPARVDTDQWCRAVASFGGRYATLVAKHMCGFTLWPSEASSGSFKYNYGVVERDIVRDLAESCAAHGVKLGIYYSVNDNAYLNVNQGRVQQTRAANDTRPVISQAQYVDIVHQQLAELWTNYSALAEIWFDGGYNVPGLGDRLVQLLGTTQPHAVVFNGCGLTQNAVEWIGSESGHAPYPVWSSQTGCPAAGSAGTADGVSYLPKEVDLTLQSSDTWFFKENMGYRPMDELISQYHDSVGHGANMLLNVAPPLNGSLPAAALDRYAALGRFVASCYGVGAEPSPLALGFANCYSSSAANSSSCMEVEVTAVSAMRFDRVLLKEEMSRGHLVIQFELLADGLSIFNGTAVGRSLIVLLGRNITANSVRLRILKARGPPSFRLLAIPDPEACGVPSAGGGGGGDGCNLQPGILLGGFPIPGVPIAKVETVAECCASCTSRPLTCVAFTAAPALADRDGSDRNGTASNAGYKCTLLRATGGKSTQMSGAVSGSPK